MKQSEIESIFTAIDAMQASLDALTQYIISIENKRKPAPAKPKAKAK